MVRFCLIGVGRAGLVHARNLTTRIHDGELVALCDANPQTLATIGHELGVDRHFTDFRAASAAADIDAVIIVTPTHLHCDIACEAARHGKHVFLEKPMAITVDECERINAAATENRIKLQLGFMRRFDEAFLRAYELLHSGELGRPMIIKSIGRGPGLPPPWIYDIKKSNGILAEVGSHDFDSVRWMIGADIARVYTEAGNFKCPEAREDWPEFYDNALVNLRFANGVIGSIDNTCPCHYGYDARMEILCERGVLQIGSIEQQGVTEVRVEDGARRPAVKSWRNLFRQAYIDELEHFIECIRKDKTPRVTGHDGLKAVEAVVAANRSYLESRPIEIEGVTL